MQKLFLCLTLILSCLYGKGQAGTLDQTFNPSDHGFGKGDGPENILESVAVQADGKIFIGGIFMTYNGAYRPGFIRLTNDGYMDSVFNQGNGVFGDVFSIIPLTNGKVLIGGDFSNYDSSSTGLAVRINANGTLDTSFHLSTSNVNQAIYSMVVQSDGKIIIGGTFNVPNGASSNFLMRLNSDGSKDTSFNTGAGANGNVRCIALQSDGKILIGGDFTVYDGYGVGHLIRLNQDGSIDYSFQGYYGADGSVRSLAINSTGKIVIGGSFTSYNNTLRNYLARLNSDGSLDTGFDPSTGPDSYIHNLTLQADGKIVIGGRFKTFNGITKQGIARVNSDGTLDNSFGVGMGIGSGFTFGDSPTVDGLAIQGNGKILVVGNYNSVDKYYASSLARLNADGTFDDTFNPASGMNIGNINGASSTWGGYISILKVQTDDKILAGGAFKGYDGGKRNHLVRTNSDGSLDTTFQTGSGANDELRDITPLSTGKAMIAGSFTKFNNVSIYGIARLNNDGSIDSGFVPPVSSIPNSFPGVSAICVQTSGKVLVSGTGADVLYNATSLHLGRLNGDGSVDNTFNPGSGPNDIVYTMKVLNNGKVIIVGGFTSYNGVPRNRIAIINTDGSLDTSFDPGTGANDIITAVDIQNDGKIVVGGMFSTFNGISRGRVARLNPNGSLDSAFTTIQGADDGINAIALQGDGKVIIAGLLTSYNGINRRSIARLNIDGSLDPSFDPGSGTSPNNFIHTIGFQSSGKLVVAGDFISYNGIGRNRIARLYTNNGQAITVDTLSSLTYCSGSNISIHYTTTGVFNSGNVFTAQLSDANGSFNNPVALGTATGLSGTINGMIPSTIASGSGYHIRVIADNPLTYSGSSSTNITITAPPSATINYSASPYYLGNGTASVTLNGTTGGVYSSTNGLSIDSNTGTINLDNSIPGTYVITYYIGSSGGCAAYADTATVIIAPPELPTISHVSNTLRSSAPSGNQWYLNSVMQAGLTSQIITPVQSGSYTVKVTVNGYSSASSASYYYLITTVNNLSLDKSITIAPNTVTHSLNIHCSSPTAHWRFQVFNSEGQPMMAPRTLIRSCSLNMDSFAAGVYVVDFVNELTGERTQMKIMKQ